MKNKKLYLVIGALIICVLIVSLLYIFVISKNKKFEIDIPDGYIAVFHGGVGERTHETYIYKIDNGHANYGFKYINVTSTTVSWGSPEWNSVVTKKGEVTWTDDVFKVAKDNNAYSFVTLPNDDKTHSIEEFMSMFMMD